MSIGSYRKSAAKEEQDDAFTEQFYRKIIDQNGNLVNDSQLHIIIAILNIDVCDLIDK